jgi:hypothetical protein
VDTSRRRPKQTTGAQRAHTNASTRVVHGKRTSRRLRKASLNSALTTASLTTSCTALARANCYGELICHHLNPTSVGLSACSRVGPRHECAAQRGPTHNRLALRKLQRTKRLLASRAQTGAPRGGHTVEGPTRGVPLVCGRHCAWRRDRHERDHAKHRIRQFVRSLGGRRPPRKRPGREARVSRGCPQGPKGHHGDQDNPKGCPKDAKGNPRVPRGSPADRKGNPKEPQEGLKGAQQDPRESRGGSKGRRAGPGGREGGSRGALARVLGPIGTSLFTGKV